MKYTKVKNGLLNSNHPIFKILSSNEAPIWWYNIKSDDSLYIEIRKENYLNVYYRGGCVARIKYNTRRKQFEILTHPKYLETGIEKTMEWGKSAGSIIQSRLSGESYFVIKFQNTASTKKKLAVAGKIGMLPIKLTEKPVMCRRGAYVAPHFRFYMDIREMKNIKPYQDCVRKILVLAFRIPYQLLLRSSRLSQEI